MVVRVTAKTMPGKSLGVERELRWRIKQALDAAGIRIVGGPPLPDGGVRRGPDGGHGGPLGVRVGDLPAVAGGVPDRTGRPAGSRCTGPGRPRATGGAPAEVTPLRLPR